MSNRREKNKQVKQKPFQNLNSTAEKYRNAQEQSGVQNEALVAAALLSETDEPTKEEEEIQKAYNNGLGKALNGLLSTFDHLSMEEGYAGLLELPPSIAEEITSLWSGLLERIGHANVPQAYIVRYLEDGSLLLKSVPMPKGVVFAKKHNASMTQTAQQPQQATIQPMQQEAKQAPKPLPSTPRAIPSAQHAENPTKKLSLTPTGEIEVSDV